jgi:hypothetical protein
VVRCPIIFRARQESVVAGYLQYIVYQSKPGISFPGFLSHYGSHSKLHSESLSDYN